jgi:sulfopyruvate decarboxylase TPP-binding subunit
MSANMRRIDAIGIALGVFVAGGVVYVLLQVVGLDDLSAGIWSQALLVGVTVVWLLSYLFRVVTKNMTYNRQLKEYEDAVLQKRLDELTPEQLEKLQAEIEAEKKIRE